jgi:hypothetical protein
MAVDPKGTFDAARGHAHRARKSAGRLAISGVGFSVAYFFDPEQGSARRKHAVELAGHLRRVTAQVKSRRRGKTTPANVATTATSSPAAAGAAPPSGLTNGSRASAHS